MKKYNLTINDTPVCVPGETLLECIKNAGFFVPTLCYLKDVNPSEGCGFCCVEVEGRGLVYSCVFKPKDGLKIYTDSEMVIKRRKEILTDLLSIHHKQCLKCYGDDRCKFQKYLLQYGVSSKQDVNIYLNYKVDNTNPCIVRNNNKCIACGRCADVCDKIQHVGALTEKRVGRRKQVSCGKYKDLAHSPCVGCGQCILTCPTAALMENPHIYKVKQMLNDPNNYVVVQIAPSVRVSFLEMFNRPIGSFDEEILVGTLKACGFKKVFDINLGADFTVVEEANELVERIKAHKNLPLFTSCCPAWFKFLETKYPKMKKHLSSCKSPTEMLGTIVKNYYAKKENIKNIKVVSIMPCTAKKYECQRADDVDAVLTTRELYKLVQEMGIDIDKVNKTHQDMPLGTYSGAGLIFGVSGGVCEAIMRTALELLTGKELKDTTFNNIRTNQSVREVTINYSGITLRACVVSGLANADIVMQDIVSGKKHYDIMEVMACPGGCINGGGQPLVDYDKVPLQDVIKLRRNAIYKADKKLEVKQSHKNETLTNIYKEFFTTAAKRKLLHYK